MVQQEMVVVSSDVSDELSAGAHVVWVALWVTSSVAGVTVVVHVVRVQRLTAVVQRDELLHVSGVVGHNSPRLGSSPARGRRF